MLWALGQTVSEAEANVTISTAHKAKGLEWRSVRLSEDFIKSVSNAVAKDEMIPESEARLFYVALTRARECVDVDQKALSVFRQLTACASRGLGIK
jgi:superfamily I DNA/RNA helicase